MTTTKIIIEENGKMFRVTADKREINFDFDLLASFAPDKNLKIKHLMAAGVLGAGATGAIGMSAGDKATVFTVPLRELPMRVAFVMDSDKLMVPLFSSRDVAQVLHLTWEIPETMRAYLLISIKSEGNNYYCDNQFLVAMDGAGRTYRLPTSNAYEDARLCPGEYDSMGQTCFDTMSKCWKQFTSSLWQSDLSDRGGGSVTGVENSQALFRYKPKEPEGFEQMPPAREWSTCCTKIANAFITTHITL